MVEARDITSTAGGTVLALQSFGDGDDFSGSLWFTTSTAKSSGTVTPLMGWGPRFATTATRFGDDALVWISDFQETTELWRTDGTMAGTRLVKGGLNDPAPRTASAGDRVFYTDPQGTLAVTDGTTGGTQRLHTWGDNGQSGSVLIYRLAAAGGLAFLMVAAPKATGAEMWVSDGTRDGTHLLRDINPGPASARPGWLTPMGSRMFFVADDGRQGRELWRSDGTARGTIKVTNLDARQVRDLTACRGRLYFTTVDEGSATLWMSDGQRDGHQRLASIPGSLGYQHRPRALTCMPGGLLFAVDDGVHGLEPWTWVEGAVNAELHDLMPGAKSSHPEGFTRVGDKIYLRARDGIHGHELWVVS